jgi:hypothetical protein
MRWHEEMKTNEVVVYRGERFEVRGSGGKGRGRRSEVRGRKKTG